MTLREAVLFVAESYLNVPYIWGGDDAVGGVDCSGYVQEVLRSAGLLSRKTDYTADGLLTGPFANRERITDKNRLRRGMLVFWARPDKTIRHVEMIWQVLADRVLTIGASGGGSQTKTREDAIRDNASVKIAPLAPGWLCAVDVFPEPF